LSARALRDPGMFADLYRRYYDPVFRYCVHRIFDRAAAEDVTSTVWVKVLKNFEQFRGDETNFRNWALRIATNCVTTHLRKTARRSRLLRRASGELQRNGSHDPPEPEKAERLALVKGAILKLKPHEQAIVILRFFEKVRLEEIAEILSSSPGTVRSQLSRALKKLRKQLSGIEVSTGREATQDV
jgi:RNA polymerase sigma factor (sigma-70 family)